MQIKHLLCLVSLFISSLIYAQDDISKASWINTPVKVDGKPNEWSLPLGLYDSDTKLFFGFANDSNNIYLCFQCSDEISQARILGAGMEVGLMTKGKHKAYINFPLVTEPETGQQKGTPFSDYNYRKTREDSFRIKDTLMGIKGFSKKDGIISIHDSSGIQAAIDWDAGDKLTYEIAIPYKEFFGDKYTSAEISKDISLEVTIHGLKGRLKPTGSHGSGMEGKGMGGRMGGGGMHHEKTTSDDDSGAPGDSRNEPNQFQKSSLRQKFVLTQSGNGL